MLEDRGNQLQNSKLVLELLALGVGPADL